ncbi:MAG: DNA gyrase inhibitor YacG [Planctomycetales bacterium]|nr:DNA gyrase inhibitor YacG [Planctomycetales bacterium]
MRVKQMDFKCPICGKAIPSLSTTPEGKQHINAPFFPFCSERCRWVDLGAWLEEDYRVSSASMTLEKESRDE